VAGVRAKGSAPKRLSKGTMALHGCCMRRDGCISNGALDDDDLDRRAEGPPWLHGCSDENALIMASGVGLAALALPSGLGVARIPIWRQ
jgi:hypothetical protein